MKIERINQIKEGDIVRNVGDPRKQPFKVMAVYGDRATAVSVVDITNPSEWEVVCQAEYTRVAP